MRRIDWGVIAALMGKDLRAVRRTKAVLIPMLAVPVRIAVHMLARPIEDGGSFLQRN